MDDPGAVVEPTDPGAPVSVPVAGDRSSRAGDGEVEVGAAGRRSVAKKPAIAAYHPDPGAAITVPVADHRDVADLSEDEVDIGVPGPVRVAKEPAIASHHADGVHTVPVPVTDDRDVAGLSVLDDEVGITGALDLSDVPGEGWCAPGDSVANVSHDADGAHTRIGEVSGDRDVSGEPEIVGLVGSSRAQRVSQLPGASGEHRGTSRVGALWSGVGEEPRRVVGVGGLRYGRGRRAGGIPFPRRDTGDDPAGDGADAWLLVVALAVPEPGTAGLPLGAIVMIAVAGAVDTGVGTGPGSTAATGTGGLVAVHVVAAVPVAEGIAFCAPPSGHHVSRGAGVDPGDVAAEVGPAVVASGSRSAVGGNDRRVGSARAK